LLQFLNCFKVLQFVRRQTNMTAHTIARAACSWPNHHVFEIYPPCIDAILINDIS